MSEGKKPLLTRSDVIRAIAISAGLHALSLNAVKALQDIGLRAAEGDEVACGRRLAVRRSPR